MRNPFRMLCRRPDAEDATLDIVLFGGGEHLKKTIPICMIAAATVTAGGDAKRPGTMN